MMEICEEPAHTCAKPNYLPADAPDASANDTDPLHHARCYPCRTEFKDGTDRPGNANLERGVADRDQIGNHLAGEGQDGEVEQASEKDGKKAVC